MEKEKSPLELRVVQDVNEKFRPGIEDFLAYFTRGVDESNPDSVLRVMQHIITGSRAAILEFERRAGDVYYRGITQKFRSDVKRLWDAGFLLGYAKDVFAAYAKLESLEKEIIAFFERTHYFVGVSQRYAIPVFPQGYWEEQVECLRSALEQHGLTPVDGGYHIDLEVSPEFLSQYDGRQVKNRKLPPARPYALCGVHGGKDTPQYTVPASLEYFETHNRIPFTFMEALSLYVAHPRFLREQECVVLLGEQYPSGKYAVISCSQKDRCLRVGLVSIRVADEIFAPMQLGPNQYHGGNTCPHYGKPSASALVTSRS